MRANSARRHQVQRPVFLPRLARADRKSLLLGTALASTLVFGILLAPTPAHAVTDCLVGPPPAPPSPGPISLTAADAIVCINTEPRENPTGDAILLVTFGANGNYIYLNNSGTLTATFAGIRARTESNYSPIDIVNSGEIAVTADSFTGASGIQAVTYFNNDSDISIVNTADITAYGGLASAFLQPPMVRRAALH